MWHCGNECEGGCDNIAQNIGGCGKYSNRRTSIVLWCDDDGSCGVGGDIVISIW